MVSNRRKYPRHKVILKVDYRDVDRFFIDFAEDLSQGGMFIATPKPLPIGTSLLLEFALPDKSMQIKTRGEVVWVRKKPRSPREKRGMGIKFQDLSKEDMKNVEELIKRLKGKAG